MREETKKKGLTLWVKAKPNSRRVVPPKRVDLGEGRKGLEITVRAPAVDGKANKEILAALASYLGVSEGSIEQKTGASGRLKLFYVEGDPETLSRLLKE